MFTFDGRGIGLAFSIGLLPMLLILIAILVYIWHARRSGWEVTEQKFNVFNQTVTIKPNFDVSRTAHKAWTELASRKAAIVFEEDHDIISEVYDSWYSLFKEIRLLVKDIPAEKIRNDQDMRKLVKLLMGTLNDGLRPHLTKWQARFRRWMDTETKKRGEESYISIQDIQRDFPDYKELVEDIKKVNSFLIDYAAALEELAHGQERGRRRIIWIRRPTQD